MKKIEAIVKPFRVEEIRRALLQAGFGIIRVFEVQEFGKESYQERRSGTRYEVEMIPRMQVQLVVEDNRADEVIRIIQQAAVTGRAGDGLIMVSTIDRTVSVDGSQ